MPAPTPYITYAGHVLLTVRCKGDCPTVLVVRRGVAQNLRVEPTPDYSELVIAVRTPPHGLLAKHETAVCKPCRARILGGGLRAGELEAIYAQDLLQWKVSAMTAGRPRLSAVDADRLLARFADFRPVCALEERGRGDRNFL